MKLRTTLWLLLLLVFAGCSGQPEVAQVEPTWTLAPLVTLTERFTATPMMTRTPLPTFTQTPSETPIAPTASDTLTPTEVPPVIGIVQSLNSVNVREGPGTSFNTIAVLDPGTGVTVLEANPEGDWLMISMEDGEQGWISAPLLRIEATSTPFPTVTEPPDLTALALGTPLPTAVMGGGTITATPPRSVVTLTPVDSDDESDATEEAEDAAPSATSGSALSLTGTSPIIDTTSIFLTTTALAGGLNLTTPTAPALSGSNTPVAVGTSQTQATPDATTSGGGAGTTSSGSDVLAYCSNNAFGSPPPRNLAAGSTVDIFWGWFAKTRAQVEDHIDNAVYDVRVNGVPLENWENFRGTIRQESDGNYHVYWYVPSEPLESGPVEITYEVTWTNEITDGYESFGPGTSNESETGTCSFTVQ